MIISSNWCTQFLFPLVSQSVVAQLLSSSDLIRSDEIKLPRGFWLVG